MRIDVPTNGDTQHSGEPLRARRAGRRPKEDEVHRIAGATVGVEEGGDCARTGAIGVPEHFRRDYPRSAATLDRQFMERGVRVSEWPGRFSQPDGRIHRRPLHASGRSEGWIRGRRLPAR